VEPWMVRVGTGCGVLLSQDTVLTCAHLIPGSHGRPPPGPVEITFPALPGSGRVKAVVAPDGWHPVAADQTGDVCILTIVDELPMGARPAPLRVIAAKRQRRVRAHGHPEAAPDGAWAYAVTEGRTGPGAEWVQLSGQTAQGRPIVGGFSGAGVIDLSTKAVVGMIASERADHDAQTSWMLPLETIADYWPRLDDMLTEAHRNDQHNQRLQIALTGALDDNAKLRDQLGHAEKRAQTAEQALAAREADVGPRARTWLLGQYKKFNVEAREWSSEERFPCYQISAVDQFMGKFDHMVRTNNVREMREIAHSIEHKGRAFRNKDGKEGYLKEHTDSHLNSIRHLLSTYLGMLDGTVQVP